MRIFDVYWSPTGEKIATVEASTAKIAKSKAPMPYKRFKGEIYVEDRGVRSTAGPNLYDRKNPGGPLDTHAAHELELYVENDAQLHRSQEQPIQKNLITKMARGVYNHTGAVKLYGYLMESGAKKYTKEYSGGSDWQQIFSPATRKAAAEKFAKSFETEAKLGNYDHMLPKKYAGWSGKVNPRIPNGRMVPARIKHNGKTYAGKVKRVNGKVKIFVTPEVARKINPERHGLKIVPVTKERFVKQVRPLLRAPYKLMPFALYKRTIGKGMYMLFRGSEFIKAGTKTKLKRYAA
jgi:hypothetical protein